MCLTIFSACYGLHNRGKQFVGSFIGREFRAAAYSPARDVLDRTRLDYAKIGLASTAHHSAYGWPLQPTTAGTTMHGIAYDHLGCHFLMHLRTRSTEPHNRSQCVVSLSVGLHPTFRCCLLLLGTGKFRIGIPTHKLLTGTRTPGSPRYKCIAMPLDPLRIHSGGVISLLRQQSPSYQLLPSYSSVSKNMLKRFNITTRRSVPNFSAYSNQFDSSVQMRPTPTLCAPVLGDRNMSCRSSLPTD